MITREEALDRLGAEKWDVVVIGGGASGLGSALDAASRGFRTCLVEAHDFAKGTSSRSTKLIHGGVRYLRQGNVSLVRESLHERNLLLRNASSVVHPLEFVIPVTSWTGSLYYATGLKLYDVLSGRSGILPSRRLSGKEVSRRVPTLNWDQAPYGVSYFDAQFDDAGLALALVETFCREGGTPANYVPVTSLIHEQGTIKGVVIRDAESGREIEVRGTAIINATGAFSDSLRRWDDQQAASRLTLSQGIHLVVPGRFLPGKAAVIVPETSDGRVVFFIPWMGSVLIGTTDVPVSSADVEPRPTAMEIDYLLELAARYLETPPKRSDVRSCFAGLRPLVKGSPGESTSKLPRDHVIEVSKTGMISMLGGKWTTFRVMGEDAISTAIKRFHLPDRPSRSKNVIIARRGRSAEGSTAENPNGNDTAVRVGPPSQRQVPSDEDVRQVARFEMARRVEDVLARRFRLLFLDAAEARQEADRIARILATELGRDDSWIAEQVNEFHALADSYNLNAER